MSVPPFYQTYEELVSNPPRESPCYSFLVDGEGRWIDHHTAAIDGPVMHCDESDETVLRRDRPAPLLSVLRTPLPGPALSA